MKIQSGSAARRSPAALSGKGRSETHDARHPGEGQGTAECGTLPGCLMEPRCRMKPNGPPLAERPKRASGGGARLEPGLNRGGTLPGCRQTAHPPTVPAPFSNITLDTGPPPFVTLLIGVRWHIFCVCQNKSSERLRESVHDDAEWHKRKQRQRQLDHPVGNRKADP